MPMPKISDNAKESRTIDERRSQRNWSASLLTKDIALAAARAQQLAVKRFVYL